MQPRDGFLLQSPDIEKMSTSERHDQEVRTIHGELLNELRSFFYGHETEILEFNFLSEYLSPVRNQRNTGTCSFVQSIACTEMIYRVCGREVLGTGVRFYFDVQECFDQLYRQIRGLPNATEKLKLTMGEGTSVRYVLQYVFKIGLLLNSACTNPQERNIAAEFIQSTNRQKLNWFDKFQLHEVIPILKVYPVIAVVRGYPSFLNCREVVYGGMTMEDKDFSSQSLPWHIFFVSQSIFLRRHVLHCTQRFLLHPVVGGY